MADYLNDAVEQDPRDAILSRLRGAGGRSVQGAMLNQVTAGVENQLYPEGIPNPFGSGPSFMPTSGRVAIQRGATPSGAPPAPGSTVTPAGPISVTDQWNQATQASAAAATRNQDLYNLLLGRAQQSTVVDPNDPAFRAQIDAFTVGQERARRSYLADAAEAAGPGANLTGEARLANEKFGQNISSFRAQLSGQELAARRQEIAGALQMMGGMLSQEQQSALQRELATMDFMLKERELGITEADRRAHYDALKRGLYKD